MNASAKILVGSVLFSLAGWLRFFVTGSFVVDGNYPGVPAGAGISILIAVAVLFVTLGSLDLINKISLEVITDWKISASVIFLLICPPLTTNDLYSYIYYGEFARNGSDPYILETFNSGIVNRFHELVSPLYQQIPSVYGPVLLISSLLPVSMSSATAAILLYKAIIVLFVILLFYRTGRRSYLFPFVLSSACLFEMAGQGHNDIVAVYFTLLMLDFAEKGKSVSSALFSVLALASKFLYFPFLAVAFLLLLKNSLRKTVLWAGIISTSLLGWYILHPYSFMAPFRYAGAMRPSGSWSAMAVEIWRSTVNADIKQGNVILFFQVFALLLCVIVFVIFWYRRRKMDISGLIQITAVFILIYFGFFIHRLLPWYILFVIPLATIIPGINVRWWVFAAGFYVLRGCVHQFLPNTPAMLFVIIPTSVIATILLTIWLFVTIRTVIFSKPEEDRIIG
ncbi:MAG: hypothetical protein IPM95_02670 [Sphingobacteriales bacterium]|nr:hypothetical protein [Sphingobacteriales bacterium]